MEKPPVRRVPEDYKSPSLRRWRVFEITLHDGSKSLHVVGHDVSNNAGRVSSIISAFDLQAMTVTTSSGRQYLLLGAPGWGRKVEQVWRDWCAINKVTAEKDVTSDYFDVDNFFHHHEEDEED